LSRLTAFRIFSSFICWLTQNHSMNGRLYGALCQQSLDIKTNLGNENESSNEIQLNFSIYWHVNRSTLHQSSKQFSSL
jgi:hypothetical protein